MSLNFDRVKRSIITVGGGRGFVVDRRGNSGERYLLVITAAHCLSHLPLRHAAPDPMTDLPLASRARRQSWAMR